MKNLLKFGFILMGLVFLASCDSSATSSIQPDIGEWTDDTHYKIKLSTNSFTDPPQLIFNVKSLRGNKLKMMDTYVNIRFSKNKVWIDAGAKKEIKAGPRFHHYDNFIYSPDKIKYVADVFLEGAFGDEGGGYYGLVLEQNKKPAIILETSYPIRGSTQELQVYWLDDHMEEYKYQTLALSMHPVKHGFYWTKVNKGSISTEYIGNKGTKAQAKGKIVGVSEQGVYLLDEPPSGEEGHDEPKIRKLYYWKSGAAPKQILLPDNLGYLKAFGQSLSAQSFDITNLYYRYELATNKWFPINKEETITTIPYQESMAVYRQG